VPDDVDKVLREITGSLSLRVRDFLDDGLLAVDYDINEAGPSYDVGHSYCKATITVTVKDAVDLKRARRVVNTIMWSLSGTKGHSFWLTLIMRHQGARGDVEEAIYRLGGEVPDE
jgi:hypothetical protein